MPNLVSLKRYIPFIPLMLQSLNIGILFLNTTYKINRLVHINNVFSLFLIGYFIVEKYSYKYSFRLGEIAIFTMLTSMAFLLIDYVLLVMFIGQVNIFMMTLSLWLINLLQNIAVKNKIKYQTSIKKDSVSMAYIAIAFVMGFALCLDFVPTIFWRGWDPWLYPPVADAIIEEGLSPHGLINKFSGLVNVTTSGFFYFLAAVTTLTGIGSDYLVKYGSLFFTGISSALMFSMIKRRFGLFYGFFGVVGLLFNPSFINRFSITFRENFSYCFLMGIITLLVYREVAEYDFLIVLFTFTTLLTHPLTAVLTFSLLLLNLLGVNCKNVPSSFFNMMGTLVIGFPFLQIQFQLLNFIFVETKLFYYLSVSIIILIILFYYVKDFNYVKYWKYYKIPFIVGGIHSLCNQSSFYQLSKYGDVGLESFSTFFISIALAGALLDKEQPNIIEIFTFFLLLLLNLPLINSPLPLNRVLIYLSILVSYYSTSFINKLYLLDFSKYITINLDVRLKKICGLSGTSIRKGIKPILFLIILLPLLFSPVILSDYSKIQSIPVRTNYKSVDYADVLQLVSTLDEDCIVVTDRMVPLLLYVGLPPERVLFSGDIEDVQSFVLDIEDNYPDVKGIEFVKISRWTPRNDTLKVYEFFRNNAEDHSGFIIERYRFELF